MSVFCFGCLKYGAFLANLEFVVLDDCVSGIISLSGDKSFVA